MRNPITPNRIFFLARAAALTLAVLGTVLFATFYYFTNSRLVGVGYFFILMALMVSGYLLLACLHLAKGEVRTMRRKARLHVGILLLNVPLCLFLTGSFFNIINYERIMLVNVTGQPLTHVRLSGCAVREVGALAVDARTEAWVPITGDCYITLEYQGVSAINKEVVIGYTTPNNGKRTMHFIGNPSRNFSH